MIAEIKISGVPVTALPYNQVYGFLITLASLLTSTSRHRDGESKTEYENAVARIDYHLMEALWDTARDFTLRDQLSFWGDWTIRLSGTPEHYFYLEAREKAKRLQAREAQNSANSPAS